MRATADRRFILQLPEVLDFENNYENTVSHFQILRSGSKTRRLKSVEFNKIKMISPSAALVLASEIDRWHRRVGWRLRADVDSWQEDIRRLLCEMGYFELLNLPKPPAPPQGNTTFLPFKTASAGKSDDAGPLAKQLRVEIEALIRSSIKRHLLFEGLSEAITNVGQHAYPEGAAFVIKRWWVSASYDRQEQQLCVMFYDQGAGIPATLPRAKFFEVLKAAFNKWSDSQKIEAAMEVGRTATQLDERGHGLQNFISFAKFYTPGRLSIYSLCGRYRMFWDSEGTEQIKRTEKRDFQNSVGGTLIEWSVKLK